MFLTKTYNLAANQYKNKYEGFLQDFNFFSSLL